MERQRNLNTAEGIGLDRLGERLALVQPSVDGTAVDDDTNSALLRIRGKALLGDGSVPSLEDMMQVVFPTAYVQDLCDGTVSVVNMLNDPRSNLGTLARPVIRAAMPAGIGATFVTRSAPPDQPSLSATVRSSAAIELPWPRPANDGPIRSIKISVGTVTSVSILPA